MLQQHDGSIDLRMSIAHPVNNGSPSTEEVIDFFLRQRGMRITSIPLDMDVIQYRGLARNVQLEASTADWILFSDADMVFDPWLFRDLIYDLEGPLRNERRVISARRISLDKDHCKQWFNTMDPFRYPCEVPAAAFRVSNWPVYQISRNCGAGYFQLVNRQYILDRFGWYVYPAANNDRPWKKGQKAASDIQFRRMVGGVKKINTRPMYHLNHERDKEEGHHLTCQR